MFDPLVSQGSDSVPGLLEMHRDWTLWIFVPDILYVFPTYASPHGHFNNYTTLVVVQVIMPLTSYFFPVRGVIIPIYWVMYYKLRLVFVFSENMMNGYDSYYFLIYMF